MSKHVTRMEIDDAAHISHEQRKVIIDSYPEHEREARTKGIPSLGSLRPDFGVRNVRNSKHIA
jgi:hypothetical protein